jgi:hypothetical protein
MRRVARREARDDASMHGDPRNSTFARIGRTYPRPLGEAQPPAASTRSARGYRITGALIVVLSALGFLGWLLAR